MGISLHEYPTITAQMQKRYIDRQGQRCPWCDHEALSGGSIDIDGGGAFQEITCEGCDATWLDHYQLTGVEVNA